jgi:hypothetical protein
MGTHGVATLSSVHAASFCGGCRLNLLRHRQAADDGVGACLSDLENKGGGPRIPTCAKMMIFWLSAPIDLVGMSCSGRLQRQTPLGDSCLKIAGSGGIRSCALMRGE